VDTLSPLVVLEPFKDAEAPGLLMVTSGSGGSTTSAGSNTGAGPCTGGSALGSVSLSKDPGFAGMIV